MKIISAFFFHGMHGLFKLGHTIVMHWIHGNLKIILASATHRVHCRPKIIPACLCQGMQGRFKRVFASFGIWGPSDMGFMVAWNAFSHPEANGSMVSAS